MHILLFILIFIIAIFVFGLSIIGFILRTIFGLGRGSSSSRPKQNGIGTYKPTGLWPKRSPFK